MYFEKLISNLDTKSLLKVSESYRDMKRADMRKGDVLNKTKTYYEKFINIPWHSVRLKKQPLFEWNGKNSNCYLFEKLNLEHKMSELYRMKGMDNEPKVSRKMFLEAMKCNTKCLNTLEQYGWKNTDIIGLPIMNYRFHVANAFFNAAHYYFSIHRYSVINEKETQHAIKKAFNFMNLSTKIWTNETTDLHKFEALYKLSAAKQLSDDQCGEKLALISEFKDMDDIVPFWNLWKQQNDTVYFKAIQTNITMSHVTLNEAFQDFLKILEAKETPQKDQGDHNSELNTLQS